MRDPITLALNSMSTLNPSPQGSGSLAEGKAECLLDPSVLEHMKETKPSRHSTEADSMHRTYSDLSQMCPLY